MRMDQAARNCCLTEREEVPTVYMLYGTVSPRSYKASKE